MFAVLLFLAGLGLLMVGGEVLIRGATPRTATGQGREACPSDPNPCRGAR
jgi:hypothetical protein